MAQPMLLTEGQALSENDEENPPDLDYEVSSDKWKPHNPARGDIQGEWAERPVRFVDGKDVGRTVAWLQSREGYPVPIRLSEVGAVVMRHVGDELRCEHRYHERVVSFMGDMFPWDEVESFARALQEHDFRLLLCEPIKGGYTYDFEPMRKATENCSSSEMRQLERQALSLGPDTPTLVDGSLEPRVAAYDVNNSPVCGLVKSHYRNYLHPQGWRTYYELKAGQRTPAFLLNGLELEVVSWYLRLEGNGGEMPNWGVVRLEVPRLYFEKQLGKNWEHLDWLSNLVCDYRCRDESYSRAPVSIYPIQRAEETLGALFSRSETLINHFYHLTSL
ncbi:MAG: hypothetical protein HXX08_14380 [Chloroflexi bacterium]|uniref:Uncharacterized protein n=1 Tax=Candidatus Chlorohelix allophototropha TaxID=3003348 RepID=A0A8T7M4Q6_9CHLR|nr:hypothetical protein [Chloroflexota bacterium]WJW70357.1 hypothetical protein OZ401_004930 [Chloroflexota bacterium L227-S17]